MVNFTIDQVRAIMDNQNNIRKFYSALKGLAGGPTKFTESERIGASVESRITEYESNGLRIVALRAISSDSMPYPCITPPGELMRT